MRHIATDEWQLFERKHLRVDAPPPQLAAQLEDMTPQARATRSEAVIHDDDAIDLHQRIDEVRCAYWRSATSYSAATRRSITDQSFSVALARFASPIRRCVASSSSNALMAAANAD